MNLRHFGVKLKASKDGGQTCCQDDRAVPTYPPAKPSRRVSGKPLARPSGGRTEEKGTRIWCGTLPGGLFHGVG
ncbi:MAG: hypothetical protein U0798_02625 [Gemmataceae bacterium]